jgi:SAM-dependent methyltransferase
VIKVSKEIRNAIIQHEIDFCRRIRNVNPEEAISFVSSEQYLSSQAHYYVSVMERLGVNPKGVKILEIGSGYGFFLVYASKNLGWNLWGIEPDNRNGGRFELAVDVLNENSIDKERLFNVVGENTKLGSNSFDVVISNDVLEHVRDPVAVLQESYRITKPGGFLIFNIPNYRWVYEGHYNMLWLPFMSKPLAQKYVAFRGRDQTYIDHLHFFTPFFIKKIIATIPELKLYEPLEFQTAAFLAERIEAYSESHAKNNKTDLRMYVLSALKGICSAKMFQYLMEQWARLTGIYHEMHMVIKKL